VTRTCSDLTPPASCTYTHTHTHKYINMAALTHYEAQVLAFGNKFCSRGWRTLYLIVSLLLLLGGAFLLFSVVDDQSCSSGCSATDCLGTDNQLYPCRCFQNNAFVCQVKVDDAGSTGNLGAILIAVGLLLSIGLCCLSCVFENLNDANQAYIQEMQELEEQRKQLAVFQGDNGMVSYSARDMASFSHQPLASISSIGDGQVQAQPQAQGQAQAQAQAQAQPQADEPLHAQLTPQELAHQQQMLQQYEIQRQMVEHQNNDQA
jgi:hypothetical protein